MAVVNSTAFYFRAAITAVKNFIVQTPGVNIIKHATFVTEALPQIS